MREIFLEDVLHPKGGITVKVKHDEDCLFCEHCSFFLLDYTNLIYLISCDEDHDPWVRPCEHFKENEE